jgi:hypothetical protein
MRRLVKVGLWVVACMIAVAVFVWMVRPKNLPRPLFHNFLRPHPERAWTWEECTPIRDACRRQAYSDFDKNMIAALIDDHDACFHLGSMRVSEGSFLIGRRDEVTIQADMNTLFVIGPEGVRKTLRLKPGAAFQWYENARARAIEAHSRPDEDTPLALTEYRIPDIAESLRGYTENEDQLAEAFRHVAR